MAATEAYTHELNQLLAPLSWQERLKAIAGANLNAAFSSSLSFEDQAITHTIAQNNLSIRIFTLDTGRLFAETYTLLQQTNEKYGGIVEVYFPQAMAVQDFVNTQGINGFYNSVANRKTCCHIRKVEPLNRALEGVEVWISGLRRAHSEGRGGLEIAQWDETRKLIKLNPLADVEEDALWSFIKEHNVPFNPMHLQGYPSIGCAPCTRAIAEGEPMRAGRWWWEQPDIKECGLHVVDGKLTRISGDMHAK